MIELKTPAEIDKMAVTGRFVAKTLAELTSIAEPGMDIMHLEKTARKLIEDAGAKSCYWDYAPLSAPAPSATSSACPSMTASSTANRTAMSSRTATC